EVLVSKITQIGVAPQSLPSEHSADSYGDAKRADQRQHGCPNRTARVSAISSNGVDAASSSRPRAPIVLASQIGRSGQTRREAGTQSQGSHVDRPVADSPKAVTG